MSGFVAVASLDGAPVDPALLRSLTDALAFRGPDAHETWIGAQVGLGHALFQTTDEDRPERQPCSLDGEVWIAGDVRVDRRAELVEALRQKGRAPARTATDPELILHAYHAWGEDLVDRLIGDYSFALWDGRNRRLFCARDHFGVKPFFYAVAGNQLIVSNTLVCIRAHPSVADTLNDTAVGDFLLLGFNCDPQATTYAAIRRLPGGHVLSWSAGQEPKVRQYWTLQILGELRFRKPAEIVEHFQDVFEAATADRLRTDRVAVQMSGGLDSSLVAATAHRFLTDRGRPFELRAHTVIYEKLFSDPERHFAGLAAGRLHIPIEYLIADDFRLLESRGGPCGRFPEPHESHNRPRLLAQLHQQIASTSRVALTGWDGDAILASSWSAHLGDLARHLKFGKAAVDAFRFARAKQDLLGAFTGRMPWRRRDPMRPLTYPTWLDSSFERKHQLKERWAEIHSKAPREKTGFSGARAGAYAMMDHPNWRPLLDGFDAGATGVPLDYRHPLLDLRVVTCALSLPAVPWCVDKHILRVLGRGMLPEAVVRRPKTGLQCDPVPFAIREHMARSSEAVRLHPDMRRYVDANRVLNLFDELGSDDYSPALRGLVMNQWLLSE